jgi:signal transduction histidine kinase
MFLKQIMDNLISNSLKYSPSNTQLQVHLQTHDDDVFIDIIDEGPGIPLEDQQRIFERFERAGNPDRPREHSIGLGLWIVALLTPLIRSKIDITHSSTQGSTFRLTLKEAILYTQIKES